MCRIEAICAPHLFVVGFNNFGLTLDVQYQHLSSINTQSGEKAVADLEEEPGRPGAHLAFWRPPPPPNLRGLDDRSPPLSESLDLPLKGYENKI